MSAPRLVAAVVVASALVSLGSAAHAGSTRRAIALIVTSNRSATLGRPDLQYADDDGAKYVSTFRMVAADADVHLLTEFDHDTAKLFPDLVESARPPTRAAVLAAGSAIARDVASARRAGQTVDFYFVFAGHGDVDGGRGFLELSDGRFYSGDLEALLARVAPSRSHVILDSCNSFFVINPRRPGGRRFATPEDVVRALGQRLPNVGVFLSTSAEAEVYEWSEFQSGIFSHAVRSGLAGGADADADGQVSYEELAGFVDTAAAGVKNPVYRPKVFARGPAGAGSATIFSIAGARAMELRVAPTPATRLTVRDRDGLDWADVHKEAGAALVLRLPADRLAGGAVEELALGVGGVRVARRLALALAPPASSDVDVLTMVDAGPAGRGPADLFRGLFTRPFGPRQLAAYRAAKRIEAPPVLGISREDTERMNLLLTHVGGLEHRGRMMGTSALVGLGAAMVGAGVWALSQADGRPGDPPAALGHTLAIAGAGAAVAGGVGLWVRSPAERLRDEFAAGLASGDDPAAVVARTEDKLNEVAEDYRRTRTLLSWSGVGMAAAGVGLLTMSELGDRSTSFGDRLAFGSMALVGGWVAFSSRFEYPIERMVGLWAADPGIREAPRLNVSPLRGGAALGLSGSF